MEFCPRCGSILMMKKTKFGCVRCSYMCKGKVCMEIKEGAPEKVGVGVVNEKEESVNPITNFTCKHCGNKKAYFWTQQMRAGDEAESKFYKCTKCEKTVRVDD